MTVVIALGGNAMTAPDGRARPEDQRAAITVAAESIADIVASGSPVVLTHGNGPQVGNLLVKNEIAASVVPPVPLDWCGAQTQGTIGVLILNALDAALARRTGVSSTGVSNTGVSSTGVSSTGGTRTAVVVSRTLVDADDPGFKHPTKPIGRYLPAMEAADLIAHGQTWRDFGEKGWRRVVASPEPLECLDAGAAAALLRAGFIVVCSGGGGVPVVRDSGGGLCGVEAVIDKDLTAAVLAQQLRATTLIIATDVDAVIEGLGTAAARPIGEIPVASMRVLAGGGQFPAGSMGPKVEAACRFAESGGRAIITSLHHIADALAGTAGTAVIP